MASTVLDERNYNYEGLFCKLMPCKYDINFFPVRPTVMVMVLVMSVLVTLMVTL